MIELFNMPIDIFLIIMNNVKVNLYCELLYAEYERINNVIIDKSWKYDFTITNDINIFCLEKYMYLLNIDVNKLNLTSQQNPSCKAIVLNNLISNSKRMNITFKLLYPNVDTFHIFNDDDFSIDEILYDIYSDAKYICLEKYTNIHKGWLYIIDEYIKKNKNIQCIKINCGEYINDVLKELKLMHENIIQLVIYTFSYTSIVCDHKEADFVKFNGANIENGKYIIENYKAKGICIDILNNVKKVIYINNCLMLENIIFTHFFIDLPFSHIVEIIISNLPRLTDIVIPHTMHYIKIIHGNNIPKYSLSKHLNKYF